MLEYTIRELIDKLNEYTRLYDAGHPAISDAEWDELYFKLVKMEEEEGIIYPDSPTQKVHFEEVSKLNKIAHNHPMLSLAKTKEISEVNEFKKANEVITMLKMDGLTASLKYENGKLVSAETRGNGAVGEDITHNIITVKNVPIEIPFKDTLIVDGEIICDIETFEKNFSNDFANPRNYAAGAIRRLNANENRNSGLSFVVWDCIQGLSCETLSDKLYKLDNLGFKAVPFLFQDKDEFYTTEDDFYSLKEIAKDLHYPIDGLVIKYNNCKFYQSLGNTEHHFRGGLAYKFYDEEYETELLDIEWTMGRTGVLTPVAIFEPVDTGDSTVERASMHNLSIMRETLGMFPEKYQRIWIVKQNQIIPQISRAERNDVVHDHTLNSGFCNVCPICGEVTDIIESDSGVLTIICSNPACEGKLANRIDHFFGKKGLDVKGISLKTIEKLIDWGWVNGLTDIFRLNEHRTEWVSKAGFGEASVGKILSAIDAARVGTSVQAFISALGIPLVGSTISKEIVKYYSTWKDFRDAVGGDWTAFDGFGPEISKAINSFDYTEADEVAEMLTFKAPDTSVNEEHSATAADLTFVITGKLTSGNWKNRDELKSYIESIGGKVAGSVSSKTNYLINNDATSGSAKNVSAKKLGIPIITEEEFIKMFKN